MSLEALDDVYAIFLCMIQEDIIFSVVGDVKLEEMPDFIVSEDVTGVNAGIYTTLLPTPLTTCSELDFFLSCLFFSSMLSVG